METHKRLEWHAIQRYSIHYEVTYYNGLIEQHVSEKHRAARAESIFKKDIKPRFKQAKENERNRAFKWMEDCKKKWKKDGRQYRLLNIEWHDELIDRREVTYCIL